MLELGRDSATVSRQRGKGSGQRRVQKQRKKTTAVRTMIVIEKHWKKKKRALLTRPTKRLALLFFARSRRQIEHHARALWLGGGSGRASTLRWKLALMIFSFLYSRFDLFLFFLFFPLTFFLLLLFSSNPENPPPTHTPPTDRQTVHLAVLHHPRHAAA